MYEMNNGTAYDLSLLQGMCVSEHAIEKRARDFCSRKIPNKEDQVAWLLRAVTCIDLTSLSGDDSFSNIQRLCSKAQNPIKKSILQQLKVPPEVFHVAAVCVYPSRVIECVRALDALNSKIPVASVAAGFPTGQFPIRTRLTEIECAIENGAREIDIVIDRSLVSNGDYRKLFEDVRRMKWACYRKAYLKAILSTGELGSLTNVYKTSMVCMMAGADFIKTSTGKESVNATLPVGLVMTDAIKDYFDHSEYKVGFKPAGGIRSAKEALLWQFLMERQLGPDYLFPSLFRIGASGLLGDIEKKLFDYVSVYSPSSSLFSYV